jgi:hypothetical protein
VKFGPDGYLYLSFGDGGSGGDPGNRAQNLDTLLGKILRIDVNDTAGGKKFGIPPSNPFALSTSPTRQMVYAYGLRNVWRFSFDPPTGRLWAGDVGQNLYEEIDIVESGKNYGWHIMEGFHCYSPSSGCDSTGLTPPIWEYSHQNSNISITGGYVVGKYIYADYGSGRIWALDPANLSPPVNMLLIDKAPTAKLVSVFGVDENKELYVSIYGANGRIYKLLDTTRSDVARDRRIAFECSIIPNPAKDKADLIITTSEDAIASVDLTNSSGIQMKSYNDVFLHRGENHISLVLSDLPAASYFLTISSGGKRNLLQVIKN